MAGIVADAAARGPPARRLGTGGDISRSKAPRKPTGWCAPIEADDIADHRKLQASAGRGRAGRWLAGRRTRAT